MRKSLLAIPAAIGLVLALTACGPAEQDHKFTVTVDSDMPTGILTLGTDHGTEQGGNAMVPYTNSIEMGAGHVISVTAQANAEATFISCKITDETGRVYADNESSGGYSVVTCSGSTGF